MDCAGVGSHLVAYHFATLGDAERDAIDAHLVSCTTCLKTYLAFKHAAERGDAQRPSSAMRDRLRAEVARTFEKPNVAPVRRSFLGRRIPLYQGVALAAIAAAVTLLVFRPPAPGRVRQGVPQVDSSRSHAESVQFF